MMFKRLRQWLARKLDKDHGGEWVTVPKDGWDAVFVSPPEGWDYAHVNEFARYFESAVSLSTGKPFKVLPLPAGMKVKFCLVGKPMGSHLSKKDLEQVNGLYHRAWSNAVGSPEYCKEDWHRLSAILLSKCGVPT